MFACNPFNLFNAEYRKTIQKMSATDGSETSSEDEFHDATSHVLTFKDAYNLEHRGNLKKAPRLSQSLQYKKEESKKRKQSQERNEELISQCCSLFCTPSTPSVLSQQTLCEKSRVAAFERLLDELMKDIDEDSLCMLSCYFFQPSFQCLLRLSIFHCTCIFVSVNFQLEFLLNILLMKNRYAKIEVRLSLSAAIHSLHLQGIINVLLSVPLFSSPLCIIKWKYFGNLSHNSDILFKFVYSG